MNIECPKCHYNNPSDSKFCKECGTKLIPLEDITVSVTKTLETPTDKLTRGTTFADRYEIIEELGKGGMGNVYRVEDTKIKEEVALKLIKPEIAADKKTINRFRNELKFARKIRHKNVCQMFDLGEDKGSHYITMEFIPGEDLKSIIKMSGQIAVGTGIKIAKQVAEGLNEAHRLGIVHRDLKPHNVMIDKEGDAHIMDFGIARSLETEGVTEAGMMIGTPEYMSPEQVEGEEVDQRSDIYSLGVMLFEMLTGQVPFAGKTPISVAMKHKSETAKNPREINAQIPEGLSLMILRCMEKEKEKRYQNEEDVLSELNRIEKEIPTRERIIERRKPSFQSFFNILKERKILETLAAFMGGGVIILEIVHWILIDHYHFPEESLDITIITLLCALICTLIWRFSSGLDKKPGKIKMKFFLIAFVILITALFDLRFIQQIGKHGGEKPGGVKWKESVAVLPLKNLSRDPERESFADRITEALIDELTKSQTLRHVIPSTSVMQYKTVTKRLEEIGKDFEVYAILEGSVLFIEKRVQITVKLIEASKEKLLWSESYERDVRSILDLPSELANAIAYEIIIKLTDPEREKLWGDKNLWEELLDGLFSWLKSHKANPELAHHIYNKGRYFMKWRQYKDLWRAWEYFLWAIEVDPNCAPAYAGLADYNVQTDNYFDSGKKKHLLRLREEAKEYAQKAVEIDNLKVETRASLARIKMIYDWDWEGTERRFKQIIETQKSDSEDVYLWYANYLMYMARFDEALLKMRHALELDPFSRIINCELGQLFYFARQYDKAIEALQKTVEMDANFKLPHLYLGRVYLQKSMYKEALAEFHKARIYSDLWGESFLETWIGIAYAKMGERSKAQEVLDELMKRLKFVYIPPYTLATINFALGENDLGFRLLDKAYEERDPRLCLLKINPIFDSVRSDQRFKTLQKKVGLED